LQKQFFNKTRQILSVFILLCLGNACSQTESPQVKVTHFISRRGDTLYDGEIEFRFISLNVPNFHIVEDPAGPKGEAWHRITEFEQKDILKTIRILGGRVLRMYTFSVIGGRNNTKELSHIQGIDPATDKPTFNEELFRDLDRGLKLAREEGIRVIIPLVDNWDWFGGDAQWAALRQKPEKAFYYDPQCKEDFKYFIFWLLNRKNTLTGLAYKDDPTIFCWELGNELADAPDAWLSEIAAYIKSVDPNHLIMDGQYQGYSFRNICLTDPHIDIVTMHYIYPFKNLASQAKGKKPFILGEFFETRRTIEKVLDDVIKQGLAGALLWSLRFHTGEGGFYYHSDFNGSSDSFQFPGHKNGCPSSEDEILDILRQKAYQIQNQTVPPLPAPEPPRLLPIHDPSWICWLGSVGALSYELERATSLDGPWEVIGKNLSENKKTTHPKIGVEVAALPLFADKTAEPGQTYYYRLRAYNASGYSAWSEVIRAE